MDLLKGSFRGMSFEKTCANCSRRAMLKDGLVRGSGVIKGCEDPFFEGLELMIRSLKK